MPLLIACLLLVFGLTAPAWAVTLYLAPNNASPAGNDNSGSNNCQTEGSPCLTFAHAVPLLNAGDTLELQDGTYGTSTGTGYPNITCDGTPEDGTALNPVTITATNARQATIHQTAAGSAFVLQNCDYWHIDGLYVRGSDYDDGGAAGSRGSVMDIKNGTFIEITGNVFSHNNRYFNDHLLVLRQGTHDVLVEKNEFFYWHRHAVASGESSFPLYNAVIRLNYFNSREYPDLPGAVAGGKPWKSGGTLYVNEGDASVGIYPGYDNIVENNLIEDGGNGTEVQADGNVLGSSDDNQFLGNVCLDCVKGVHVTARGDTEIKMPRNTVIKDVVLIDTETDTFLSWSGKGTVVDHFSAFGNGGTTALFDIGPHLGDGNYTFTLTNSQVQNATNYGFFVDDQDTWTASYLNAYNNSINYRSDGGGTFTNNTTVNPQFGTCYLWVPSTSPLSGAGESGEDIGATVLYMYDHGTLTSTALWDKTDGHWLHAASGIVSGLNDVVGDSLSDIHVRLNVNQNGCSLPSGYDGGGGSPAIPVLSISAGKVLSWTGDMTGIDEIKIYYNSTPGLGMNSFRRYIQGPLNGTDLAANGTGTWNDLDTLGAGFIGYVSSPVASAENLYVTICTVDTDVSNDCVYYSNEVTYVVP